MLNETIKLQIVTGLAASQAHHKRHARLRLDSTSGESGAGRGRPSPPAADR